MSCPACGATVGAADQFCESCGAALVDAPDEGVTSVSPDAGEPTGAIAIVSANAPAPCSCGGAIDADGWCTVCGLRGPSERDHFTEQPAPSDFGGTRTET